MRNLPPNFWLGLTFTIVMVIYSIISIRRMRKTIREQDRKIEERIAEKLRERNSKV